MLLFATMEQAHIFFAAFENNALNWLVLVGALCWLVGKYMPPVFAARKESITQALSDAARARAEGQAFLQEQKEKTAGCQKEMDKILAEAVQIANQMRQQMEAQGQKEIEDLKERIAQEIANERQMAISQLRKAAGKAAITLAQAALPSAITDGVKARLLDQFVEQLEERGQQS